MCIDIDFVIRNISLSDAEEWTKKVLKMGPFWNNDAILCVISYCITSSIWFKPPLEEPNCQFIYSTFMVRNICCCLICISGIFKVFLACIILVLSFWFCPTYRVRSCSLFSFQWCAGFISFLYPLVPGPLRAAYLPIHVFLGLLIFILACIAAVTGITEELLWKDK